MKSLLKFIFTFSLASVAVVTASAVSTEYGGDNTVAEGALTYLIVDSVKYSATTDEDLKTRLSDSMLVALKSIKHCQVVEVDKLDDKVSLDSLLSQRRLAFRLSLFVEGCRVDTQDNAYVCKLRIKSELEDFITGHGSLAGAPVNSLMHPSFLEIFDEKSTAREAADEAISRECRRLRQKVSESIPIAGSVVCPVKVTRKYITAANINLGESHGITKGQHMRFILERKIANRISRREIGKAKVDSVMGKSISRVQCRIRREYYKDLVNASAERAVYVETCKPQIQY